MGAFVRDERGSITVEFILWIPLIAAWLVASIAFFDAYLSRIEASKVAQTISDILSRQEQVTPGFFTQLTALRDGLLVRNEAADAMRISSIIRTTDDDYQVLWSCVSELTTAPMTDEAVPAGIMPEMAPLENVIMTELTVPWTSIFSIAGLTDQVWETRIVVRPRFTPLLQITDPDAC